MQFWYPPRYPAALYDPLAKADAVYRREEARAAREDAARDEADRDEALRESAYCPTEEEER